MRGRLHLKVVEEDAGAVVALMNKGFLCLFCSKSPAKKPQCPYVDPPLWRALSNGEGGCTYVSRALDTLFMAQNVAQNVARRCAQ